MKKVVLTGATGFIGRHTIPFLLQQGYQVHAIYHNRKSVLTDNDSLIWHYCDLLNIEGQKKVFSEIKPTHLLHFAWNIDHKTYLSSLDNQRWVAASFNMIKNLKENKGERAVLAGTCFEYDSECGKYLKETTPLRACSLYGACKIDLHKMIKSYVSEKGISYAWGRIFFLYGPHEQPTRLVPSIILSLLQNQTANCLHGNLIRDFLYVEDVASAFVALLESNISGPVNIASGRPVSLKDIVNIIAEKLDKKELIGFGKDSYPSNEPGILVAEVTRLNSEIGWRPKYDLDRGLEQTINWWKITRQFSRKEQQKKSDESPNKAAD
jgi:nucleoside-diphosphate-sugar epimerase